MKQLLQRLSSALLAAAMLASLLVTPASAVEGSSFSDISDPVMANAAEVLRLLNVVNGTGSGAFNPSGTLTRAEFCKMTVEILGRGDEEPAQRGRTLFTDVGASHWARGYVNLASSITLGGGEDGKSGTRLIMGVGDGTFRPDRPITYGEAAAILMRVLGYGNNDVAAGSHWYDGYVAVAKSSGLSDGVSLSGSANLSRGQAAVLFYNLLFTKSKGSEEIYLTRLGGQVTDTTIVLSTDAKAEDGTSGSVLTAAGVYKTDHAMFSSSFNGTRARLVLDSSKKLLAVLPDEDSTFRSVAVMGSPQANAIPIVGDETISAKLSTPVYSSDGAETTYEKIWNSLRSGTSLVLCYNGAGQLDYIYRRSAEDAAGEENVMVAKNVPNGKTNPFSQLTGGSGCQIYKNGVPADLSDLRQYDVGVWDSGSNTLFVSDLKLSGYYEDVYPNTVAPSTITVMGATLEVLPCAVQDLSAFKVGDRVTLLLTASGQVAGAVSHTVAKSNIVGVATVTGSEAEVKLLDGLVTVKGTTTLTEAYAATFNGRLVTVSSHNRNQITLSEVRANAATAAWDLTANTLGSKTLSPGVRIFEQVGNGDLAEIERHDITVPTIPASKITYVGYDWAGRVDKVVLDDVTGDRYDYGMISYRPAGQYRVYDSDGRPIYVDPDGNHVHSSSEGTPLYQHENGKIQVTNSHGDPSTSCVVGTAEGAKDGRMGGIAQSLRSGDGGTFYLGAYAPLQAIDGLRRAQFDAQAMTLTTNNLVLPIADKLEVYNKTTDSWYTEESVNGLSPLQYALTFSDDLTAYYDRTPETGGKVRVIVVK